jgi:hypothetical protein
MILQSARGLARWARLTTAAVIIGTVALAGGAAYAAPSAGAAEVSVAAAAHPCGLSGEMKAHPLPGWNWYHYRIRNCHNYDVRRRVNVSNTVSDDGPCLRIPARGIVFAARLLINTQFDGIYGLKRC